MSHAPTPLAGQLLIALPSLADPNFARSVVLLCQHDRDGAMGVIVNRASEYTLGEVFAQMDIACSNQDLCARHVLSGGPVHPERGFVVHDGEAGFDSSLEIGPGLRVTTSRDVLEAIAGGDGPANAIVALGCAGWGAGQLEHELTGDSWLNVPADNGLLFEVPLEARWQAAAGRLGVDLQHLAGYSGRA
ncbi:MAG: YqgE/AlgH family protein [Gammaproteobacteria bacterium]|nr:YqgE/AlgH family protein [Gammaproteobacteria bacterium]